jgi:hypothetical protein
MFGKFELHIHTKCVDGAMDAKQIVEYAERIGLKGISMTDHNTLKAYNEIKRIKTNLVVIPGAEISTDHGHLLALGIKYIPHGTTREIIDDVHEQGGVVVIAHPCGELSRNASREIIKYVDAVEVINGRTFPWGNAKAFALAKKYNKPMVSGSDAHFLESIGNFACYINGETVKSVLKSIKTGKVILPKKQTYFHKVFLKKVKTRIREVIRGYLYAR